MIQLQRKNQSRPQNEKTRQDYKKLSVESTPALRCVFCGKRNFTKQGFRQTKRRGKIQKYFCRCCGKYFTQDDGFYHKHYSARDITACIDLYYSNLSSRKVRNHFIRHCDDFMSHHSVLAWARTYALKVNQYISKLSPSLSGKCYADDTQVKVLGKRTHFWVAVDWGTRFISATHYSLDSGMREAKQFIQKCSKNGFPEFIQTDSAMFYPRVFKKVYGRGNRKPLVEHRITNARRTGKHNVRIETVFMKIKDRVDDFRGLKALWSAPILLTGIVLQHNFIENHSSTRRIPCELAGLDLNCSRNKWLGLIRLASSI